MLASVVLGDTLGRLFHTFPLRNLRHWQPMIGAVALHCLCESLAQFRTKTAEFDSLAGVFEWDWANFHRFVRSFVPVLKITIN